MQKVAVKIFWTLESRRRTGSLTSNVCADEYSLLPRIYNCRRRLIAKPSKAWKERGHWSCLKRVAAPLMATLVHDSIWTISQSNMVGKNKERYRSSLNHGGIQSVTINLNPSHFQEPFLSSVQAAKTFARGPHTVEPHTSTLGKGFIYTGTACILQLNKAKTRYIWKQFVLRAKDLLKMFEFFCLFLRTP